MAFDRNVYERQRREALYAQRPDVPCACGCERILPKKPLGKKWFSEACRNAVQHAKQRAERAKGVVERRPMTKFIWEAKADTAPRLCPWCDEPLPQGRKVNCGDAECTRAYQRAYRAARCEAARAGRPLQVIPCACGCGQTFQQDRLQRKYLNDRHCLDHRNQRSRERRAANPKPRGRPKRTPFMRPFGKRTEPKGLRPFMH